MTAVSTNVCIHKLNDIVNEYDNTYHRTIKMKPTNVKDNTHIDFNKEVHDKDPKFKLDDHVRTSKYKNIFAKGYTPNKSQDFFVIKKAKNTVPWTYVISDLNGEKNYDKEFLKTRVTIIHLISRLIKKYIKELYINI